MPPSIRSAAQSRQGRAGPGSGIRKAPLPAPAVGLRLYTADGARKYVTADERDAFLREAERTDRQVRTLCMTLADAGCRLSEALALTVDRVDLTAGVLVFATLKKRAPRKCQTSARGQIARHFRECRADPPGFPLRTSGRSRPGREAGTIGSRRKGRKKR